MRIFLSLIDESGTKRNTRINISNCVTTSILIKQICKEIKVSKSNVIIKMKHEPQNLRILENWPIEQYPVKNGSMFLIEFIRNERNEGFDSPQSLDKIQEQQDAQEQEQSSRQLSFLNSSEDNKYASYFQDSLCRMLEAVRSRSLQQTAVILNELPQCNDQKDLNRLMGKKLKYLLNENGDCGRSALHWAIHVNSPQIVSFLIIKGANPTIITIDKYTSLQLAVQHHSPQIMSILLQQKKIDVNQVTIRGTALHLAVANEDKRCIQILFKNDADISTQDMQCKTPLQICKNAQIRSILQKRLEIKYLPKPKISKGKIFKITSMTYRAKQKILQLNPFKNVFIVSNQQKVEQQHAFTSISEVERVEDKSWLMSSKLQYFKLVINRQDQETLEMMFGVKNNKIYKKWLQAFSLAIKYNQFIFYIKPTPANEQVIQIIDDEKNQIILYKRKVQNSISSSKKNISIMNLKTQQQKQSALFTPTKKSYELKKTHQSSESMNSSENDQLRESEIMLGSVLQSKSIYAFSSHSKASSESQSSQQKDSFSQDLDNSRYKFRKNSDQKVQIVSQFKTQQKIKISYNDFIVERELGSGAFGQVYLAKFKRNDKLYAVKVLNKKKLVIKKHLKYAVGQANILKKMDSPFIVKLYFAFQTPLNLYMVIDNCSKGDLSELIIQRQKLSEHTARFIVAQLILAIEYLHNRNILYRDLKPQNILIGSDGYIRLTDFGLSRQNSFSTSFCGSPAYLSPEMLQKKGVGFSSDIYGIGCVLYEMLIGEPPYYDESLDILLENIKNGKLRYASYLSVEAKSLISKLLQRDINKRLGVKNISQIKRHDFLKKIDWQSLQNKKINPPKELLDIEQEKDLFQNYNLQASEEIRLVDYDYNSTTGMLNRIKNFTFVRDDQLNTPPQIISSKSSP